MYKKELAQKSENRKSKRSQVAAIAMAGVLSLGAIGAYLTDGDTTTNTFTVGQVTIDLTETNWNPDSVKMILPEEEYAKNPEVTNDGVNSAYVFVEVKVPCANVTTADETGKEVAAAKTQLFNYDVNEGWYLVDSTITDTENTYVYAYGTEEAMTELKAEETTSTAVFDYVRFANINENSELELENLDIVVNAYAIQTTNLNDADSDINGVNTDGKVAAADVWSVVNNARTTDSLSLEQTNEDEATDVKASN